MKTKALKTLSQNSYLLSRSLIMAAVFVSAAPVQAFNTVDCLKDLMPLTERAHLQPKRQLVEAPFMADGGYMVFPEIVKKQVVGFYFYKDDKAWHYDSVKNSKGVQMPIAALKFSSRQGVLQLVAQPEGLETVALQYLPGYGTPQEANEGPAMLGASVLPVVGAFVSRPEREKTIYNNPKNDSEDRLKAWVQESSGGRKPAANRIVKLNKTMMTMVSEKDLDESKLWAPLKNELKMRRQWIQGSNLDEATFRKFNGLLQTTCKSESGS